MEYLIIILVCFFSSVVGAICGIGGGVIIKPVLDAVGIGAVLYWILGMGNAENVNNSIFPLLIYIISAQWKRKFRPEFEGTDGEEQEEKEEES